MEKIKRKGGFLLAVVLGMVGVGLIAALASRAVPKVRLRLGEGKRSAS